VGGTGFLGHHICKKLIIQKYKVFSLSSKRPNKNRLVKGVKYIVADIRSKNKLKILDQKEINHVINLAGYIDHS
jgi:nucleoside-diphosphate-sugar epimerase